MKTRLHALLLPVWIGLASVGIMVVVNTVSPEPTWEKVEGRITRYQERVSEFTDPDFVRDAHPVALLAYGMVGAMVMATGDAGGLQGMRNDVVFYALLWPLCMAMLTSWAFWPLGKKPAPVAVSAIPLLGLIPLSDEQARWIYLYCCDFIINLANFFGTGYLEMNGWFFGVLFPGYTLAMVVVGCVRRIRFRVRATVRANP